MASPIALSDLLIAATAEAIGQQLLNVLQSYDFPVSDWNEGGTEKTKIMAFRQAIFDFSASLIPTIAGGGFLDYASGNWLTLLAKQLYNVDRNVATNTIGNMLLACNSANGPYTFTAGQLVAIMPSGLRYVNVNGGVLNTSGTLQLQWRSEFPNDSLAGLNYVDASGTAVSLVTPFPGVTITNPAPTYSAVTQTGGVGTGTVTPSGVPAGSHNVTIRIDVSGQVGVASWSYSVDGGAFVSAGTATNVNNLGGVANLNVTLANGAGNPSFVAGETYAYATPGSWITQQGTDEERDPALRTRCRARWPSLSKVPTLTVYDLFAREASSQVTQVYVATDPLLVNRVNIYIGGQGGVLPASVVAAVQAYINPRVPITDRPLVLSPAERTVAFSTSTIVEVKTAQLAAAQAAIQAAIATYITAAGINGIIRAADIIEIIMATAGVVNVFNFAITGANSNGVDLQLPVTDGAVELPKWVQVISSAWTWRTVA